MCRSHPVELLIHRADQHLPPKPLHHARRLPLLLQPLGHRDRIQILAPTELPLQRRHPANQRDLLAWAQKLQTEKGLCEMRGSGQSSRRELRNAPARLNKIEPVVPVNGIGHTEPSVKIEETGAAPKENVLRI